MDAASSKERAWPALGSVVVGVDGSPGAEAALRWAVTHAAGDLHVLHAVSPVTDLLEAVLQIDSMSRIQRAKELIDGPWTEAASAAGERIHRHVVEDQPARALVETAVRVGAEAVVVGSSGHERLGNLLGANAGKLVHVSRVPVVIVPADHTGPGTGGDHHVVVGVDGTNRNDRRLLEWVAAHRASDCDLELLHVLPRPTSWTPATTTSDTAGHRRAEAGISALLRDGGLRATVTVVDGDPLHSLAAASRRSDLVVVGSHHSSTVGGFFTGAIAQHLPAVSECPVALIPA